MVAGEAYDDEVARATTAVATVVLGDGEVDGEVQLIEAVTRKLEMVVGGVGMKQCEVAALQVSWRTPAVRTCSDSMLWCVLSIKKMSIRCARKRGDDRRRLGGRGGLPAMNSSGGDGSTGGVKIDLGGGWCGFGSDWFGQKWRGSRTIYRRVCVGYGLLGDRFGRGFKRGRCACGGLRVACEEEDDSRGPRVDDWERKGEQRRPSD